MKIKKILISQKQVFSVSKYVLKTFNLKFKVNSYEMNALYVYIL